VFAQDIAFNGLYGVAGPFNPALEPIERVEMLLGPSTMLSGMPLSARSEEPSISFQSAPGTCRSRASRPGSSCPAPAQSSGFIGQAAIRSEANGNDGAFTGAYTFK
jgi:hypothetical protein